MSLRIILWTLMLGMVLPVVVAAEPPRIENKVPIFPQGEEYREAWPPVSATPAQSPATRSAKQIDCEALEQFLRKWFQKAPFDLLLRAREF